MTRRDEGMGATGSISGSDGRLLFRVTEAAVILSLSRSVVFDLMRTGRLRSVKQGRTRLIPLSAMRDYIALLEREAA